MTLTFKQRFNIKHKQPKDKSNSLDQISKLSGYTKRSLQTVYNKGVGAFRTNRSAVRPHITSADHWGYSRVYAAINPKSKAYKIDKTHLKK